jgi:hypothetical protein
MADIVRIVRIPEELYLTRPDLWSRAGLEAYLREHGIDPSRSYGREQTFVQAPASAGAPRAARARRSATPARRPTRGAQAIPVERAA